jgi:hypothetical protein
MGNAEPKVTFNGVPVEFDKAFSLPAGPELRWVRIPDGYVEELVTEYLGGIGKSPAIKRDAL